MEIINKSHELSNEETYFLTKARDIQKMQSVVDQELDITSWVIYTDTNENGEIRDILSLRTAEDETFATNSPSFIKAFLDILECFRREDIHTIKVLNGVSKAGRKYLYCVYVR